MSKSRPLSTIKGNLPRRLFHSTHVPHEKWTYTVLPHYPFPRLHASLRADLPAAVRLFDIHQPMYRQRTTKLLDQFVETQSKRKEKEEEERFKKCERDAGILVPLCRIRKRSAEGTTTPFEPGFLFTVRSQSLRKHAGEVRYVRPNSMETFQKNLNVYTEMRIVSPVASLIRSWIASLRTQTTIPIHPSHARPSAKPKKNSPPSLPEPITRSN